MYLTFWYGPPWKEALKGWWLSMYLPIYLSICLSIYVSSHLPVCLSVFPVAFLFISLLSIFLSFVYLSTLFSTHLFPYFPSICSFCWVIVQFIYLLKSRGICASIYARSRQHLTLYPPTFQLTIAPLQVAMLQKDMFCNANKQAPPFCAVQQGPSTSEFPYSQRPTN